MPRSLKEQFERLLEREGGLYAFDDVIERIKSGKFQSFADEETIVVTEVHDYPLKRILNINYVVGTTEGFDRIMPRVEAFQKEIGAAFITSTGRFGWIRNRKFKDHGRWKYRSVNLMRV